MVEQKKADEVQDGKWWRGVWRLVAFLRTFQLTPRLQSQQATLTMETMLCHGVLDQRQEDTGGTVNYDGTGKRCC